MSMIKKMLMAGVGADKPGFVEYDTPGTYTFEVPKGYNKVTVCMIGGGGSGAAAESAGYPGGGYAGTIISQELPITYGQVINITVGTGGIHKGGCNNCSPANGAAGTATTVDALTAPGGAGGIFGASAAPSGFLGAGGSRITCVGMTYDGTRDSNAFGGQAGLGKGGDGMQGYDIVRDGKYNAESGVRGAGGGGSWIADADYGFSGYGGNGYVKISWGL